MFPFGAVVGREKAKDWGMEDVKGIEVVGVQMAEDSEVDRYERTVRTVQEKVIESGPYRKTPKSQPELCLRQPRLQIQPLQQSGRDRKE